MKLRARSASSHTHATCVLACFLAAQVVDVVRETSKGFVRGHFVTEELEEEEEDSRSRGRLRAWGGGSSAGASLSGQSQGSAWNGGGSMGAGSGRHLVVEFQNENLLAYLLPAEDVATAPAAPFITHSSTTPQPSPGGEGALPTAPAEAAHPASGADLPQQGRVMPLACVPDLICSLETASGRAVATEELRYGLRLSVITLPAHALLLTPEALAVAGPAAFGYSGDMEHGIGNVRSLAAATAWAGPWA